LASRFGQGFEVELGEVRQLYWPGFRSPLQQVDRQRAIVSLTQNNIRSQILPGEEFFESLFCLELNPQRTVPLVLFLLKTALSLAHPHGISLMLLTLGLEP
jgi:hypothetical protein